MEATSAERKAAAEKKREETLRIKAAKRFTNSNNRDSFIVGPRSNKTVVQAVENGKASLTVNASKQGRHIKGSKDYIQGRSYLNCTLEEAQELVYRYAGTGEAITSKMGWTNKERVTIDHVIGKYVESETGEEVSTRNAIIIYSKTGTHIVPAKG